MRFAGRSMSFQGALLALICFFLPWATVSCGDRTSTVSGTQMAFGGTVQTNQGPEQRDPDIFILVLFLFGIAILLLVIFAWARNMQSRGLSITLVVISALSVLMLLWRFLNQQSDPTNDPPITVTYHAGFYGTALGYVLALIGSIVDLVAKRPDKSAPT